MYALVGSFLQIKTLVGRCSAGFRRQTSFISQIRIDIQIAAFRRSMPPIHLFTIFTGRKETSFRAETKKVTAMKKLINVCFLLTALLLMNTVAKAQEKATPVTGSNHQHKVPAYVSDRGYWIVESNIYTPRQCTIRFYNNDHVMVYTEKVEGVQLKLKRKKVKMHLKQVLETTLVAWELQKQSKENEGWVINAIGKK
jgi:hypothetical protein